MTTAIGVMLVVEDALSEAVMRRLLGRPGRAFGVERILVADGVNGIKRRIPAFLNGCRHIPHVVLADLDTGECAPQLLARWQLSRLPAGLVVRIAVREVEAWLLADADGLAAFLQVAKNKIASRPETLDDPKLTLVNIARRSRSRRLASEIAPPSGSYARTGPLYNQRLCRFASDLWNVHRAAPEAPSLARALKALDRFHAELSSGA